MHVKENGIKTVLKLIWEIGAQGALTHVWLARFTTDCLSLELLWLLVFGSVTIILLAASPSELAGFIMCVTGNLLYSKCCVSCARTCRAWLLSYVGQTGFYDHTI